MWERETLQNYQREGREGGSISSCCEIIARGKGVENGDWKWVVMTALL